MKICASSIHDGCNIKPETKKQKAWINVMLAFASINYVGCSTNLGLQNSMHASDQSS